MMRLASLFIIGVLFASQTQSEPAVIFDAGGTVSTAPYLQLFSADQDAPDFRKSWLFENPPPAAQGDIDKSDDFDTFPIVTTKMRPGAMNMSIIGLPQFPYPLCIVGADQRSLTWVDENIDRLVEMNAQCFLVQAESLEQARPVLERLSRLLVYPANGDGLSDQLGLTHYPVLIFKGEASQ